MDGYQLAHMGVVIENYCALARHCMAAYRSQALRSKDDTPKIGLGRWGYIISSVANIYGWRNDATGR